MGNLTVQIAVENVGCMDADERRGNVLDNRDDIPVWFAWEADQSKQHVFTAKSAIALQRGGGGTMYLAVRAGSSSIMLYSGL